MGENQQNSNCALHELEIEYIKKELEEFKTMVQTLQTLAIQIERIATETKHTREEFTVLSKRVYAIESKPAKKYEQISMIVTSTIIGILLGAVAIALGIKK